MSAQEQMRAMLDQLMGTGRDGENNKFKVSFCDIKVCKSFLMGCCPHDILASTRMDLGECPRIHDLALKADFEAASQTKEYHYDLEAMDHLQNFIGDCDRRTEQAKLRLAETQDELSCEASGKANIVQDLGEHIGKKLALAEKLGAEGNIEESLKYMEEVEEIRRKKALAEQEFRNTMPASSYQQQKLRVCEVCSAYLGIHDNDRRLADHFGGKLHLGFITIREHLAKLREQVESNLDVNAMKEIRERKSREEFYTIQTQRQKERENGRDRNRDHNRGNRDHRERRRSRSRNRSSRSHRSGSGERKRRSRSRSHSKRKSSHRPHSRERRHRRRSSDED